MNWLRTLWSGPRTLISRCLAIFLRPSPDLDDEIAAHLAFAIEENRSRGMTEEQARTAALRSFGGVAQTRENYRLREGLPFLEHLRRDLAYALRQMRKAPAFTLIAILTLALGIGANTVIFTVAKHVLLDRLAVPHPEELRMLWWSQGSNGIVHSFWGYFSGDLGDDEVSTSLSYPVYQQLRRNHSLAGLFAFKPFGRMTATIDGQAEAVTTEMVSGNYYSSLGVRPALGRAIDEADDGAPGSGPVVVISDHFWVTRFNRSPAVIGRRIDVNLTPMTIIGVNPPGFTGAYDTQLSPDLFLPFSMQAIVSPKGPKSLLTDTDLWWVLAMGRVRPGVSDSAATASLNVAFSAAIRATMPVRKNDQLPRLLLRDGSRGQNEAADNMARPLYVLLSLSGFVLLLACANLANLLLARSSARQREISVRMALGASRHRILRQMFTESLLLSLLGGAAGLLLGYSLRNVIPRLLSNSWEPPAYGGNFDWPIFAFAAALSIATGLIFGLAPAWQASRTSVTSGLKESAQTTTHRRKGLAGKSIVVIQVSLSMLLLVGAGLFVRTLINLGDTHIGFLPNHLLLVDIEPPATRYPPPKDLAVYRQIEEKLAAVPGVDAVTLSENALIAGSIGQSHFWPSGRPKTDSADQGAFFNSVGARFFSTMGIPLIAGRSFNDGDTETSTKVAVVDRALADKFFPHTDPIGQTFTTDMPGSGQVTIVGICGNTKYARVSLDTRATYYTPYRQRGDHDSGMRMTFEISTRMKPEALVPLLRTAVQSIDRNLPLLDVRTQKEQIAATMQQQRLCATLTAAFGILALVLACIGIYGMMAWTVARRTNEIGIRMALGARSEQVLRMVLREALWMTAVGVVLGLGGALLLGRMIASLLFGLKSWDPGTLAMAAAVLLAVALASSWIPARRAATVDPSRALRAE
jgi:predicted permease